jgi:hypothetical protein
VTRALPLDGRASALPLFALPAGAESKTAIRHQARAAGRSCKCVDQLAGECRQIRLPRLGELDLLDALVGDQKCDPLALNERPGCLLHRVLGCAEGLVVRGRLTHIGEERIRIPVAREVAH